ncbi:MAG: tetratricopeptide repeat protein [Verrucomicrobia bacterium]|jgi:tetratricopeptide (TPR) repeat protein|nr:tetratricopeptide repeat protein [Verrucomicrobiota bacterium]
MPWWKKGLFLLVLAVVPVLCLLVTAEGLLRLFDYGDSGRLFLVDPETAEQLRPNPRFTAPYFGALPPRELFPCRVARERPPESLRIVVLGASAAQGDPEPSFSPARLLEKALRFNYPETEVECINLAITATNSHVLRETAAEALALEPDLAILYIGNNEVIGPFGPGTGRQFLRGGFLPPAWQVRLQRLRLTQLLQSAVRGARGKEAAWEGLRAFTEHEISPDDPALGRAYAAFSGNLETAVATLTEGGVRVLAGTVAVNRRDQPPFAGEAARAAFRRGRDLLAGGETDAAWRSFEKALALDRLRLRADAEINRRVRELAADAGLSLADAQDHFQPGRGPVGYQAFWEHVHFTFEGNYHLAGIWYAEAVDMLRAGGILSEARDYPGIEKMRTLLGYNPYEEWRLLREMIDRLGKPPFPSVPGNPERLKELRSRRDRIATELKQREVKSAIEARLAAALAFAPEDWVLLRQAGDVHRLYGEWERAAARYRDVLARLPELEGTWSHLGQCHLELGDLAKAEEAFAEAHRRNPDSLPHLRDLALVRLNLGRTDAALALLREGLRRAPEDFLLRSLLFEAHLARGEQARARALEADLIARRPESGGPEYRMARLYLKYGDTGNALRLGRAALRKAPREEAYARLVRRLEN